MRVRDCTQPKGPYARRELTPVELPPGAEPGPYKGMQYANVHPWIGNLAYRPEGGVDHEFVHRCNTVYSIDDLLVLVEIEAVGRSWAVARDANRNLPEVE